MQAFGISEEEISKYVGNGIILWGDLVTGVIEDVELRINQTRNSPTTSLVTVLLEGRCLVDVFTGCGICILFSDIRSGCCTARCCRFRLLEL